MSGKHRINVIVPVYNVEKYLDELMSSIEKQSFSDYMVIAIDDCSTDDSYEVLKKHKKILDDKLEIIQNSTNKKLYGARNVGLEIAEQRFPSEYTVFPDSDDILEENFFNDLYKAAVENDADMAISGMQRIEDETGNVLCTEMVNFPHNVITNLHLFDDFAFINPSVCNKLFKSDKIKNIRFRKTMRSEDTLYLMEVLPKFSRVIFTNKVGYYYRIRPDSLTTGIGQEYLDSMYPSFGELYKKFLTDEYAPFKDFYEVQTYIRIVLGGVIRVAFQNRDSTTYNIDKSIRFMDEVMPEWRKNKYLSFGKSISKSKKHLVVKISAIMYRHHMLPILIDLYKRYLKILKTDVRL